MAESALAFNGRDLEVFNRFRHKDMSSTKRPMKRIKNAIPIHDHVNSSRTAGAHLALLLCLSLTLAANSVQAGVFYDGDVTGWFRGYVSASASPTWSSGKINPSISIDRLELGVETSSDDMEWTRTQKISGST